MTDRQLHIVNETAAAKCAAPINRASGALVDAVQGWVDQTRAANETRLESLYVSFAGDDGVKYVVVLAAVGLPGKDCSLEAMGWAARAAVLQMAKRRNA